MRLVTPSRLRISAMASATFIARQRSRAMVDRVHKTATMRELLHAIERWKVGGVPAAMVRTVEVKGFGAAQYDNAMVIGRDGERAGEVLRGVSDRSVAAAVDAVLDDGAPRLV